MRRYQTGTFLLASLLAIMMVLAPVGAAHAQGNAELPPMAAASEPGTLKVYGTGTDAAVVTENLFGLPRVKWSPDGRYLTYAEQADDGLRLMMTDLSETLMLADLGSGVLLPAAFAPDGTQVFYVEAPAGAQPTQGANDFELALNVYARTLNPVGEPQMIGQLTWHGLGCGGGSPFPMDQVRGLEAGFMGNDLVFHWTRFGLVYSLNCTANGLGLFDPTTGESSVLVEDFARPAFAPDGSQIAGVRFEGNPSEPASLAIYDLDGRSVYPMQTQQPPDQVAWAGDGSLFYSTRIQREEPLSLGEDAPLGYGTPIPAFDVTVNRLNRISGEETQVFSGQAWGVGRFASTAFDLYFSVIPSGREWLEALASSELAPGRAGDFLASWPYLAPNLYRVSLSGGEAEPVASQVSQFALRPTG